MKQFIKWSGRLSLIIGGAALLVILLQGPGYKAGWWGFATSFLSVFPKVVIAGGIAILLGTVGLLGSKLIGEKASLLGLVGIITGFVAAFVPISIKNTVSSLPMIHDITTDTRNPPEFVYVVPLRADAINPVSYDPKISSQQLDAYPDIKIIIVSAKPVDVYAAAVVIVDRLDWSLVGTDDIAYRLEATETSTWFGFTDDIVVRISMGQNDNQTHVDVRSKSRVGRSDLGINAKRIRKFREALFEEMATISKS